METQEKDMAVASRTPDADPESMRTVIRQVIGEYMDAQRTKAEPAHRAELAEERRRREQLERRVNELAEENRRARAVAEQADRSAAIRSELQRLGVAKVDLAYKAVKDDVVRSEDGRLVARDSGGEVGFSDYLARFVKENPELLPARVTGGSGSALLQKTGQTQGIDMDRIKPGMDPAELDQVRREILRIAAEANG